MLLLSIAIVPVAGVSLVLTGLIISLFIGKRRFDRRGVAGLQHFSSYWTAIIITIIEWVFVLAARLMIITGLLLLLIQWYNNQ